jgi:hypothetical protein
MRSLWFLGSPLDSFVDDSYREEMLIRVGRRFNCC